MNRIKVNTNFFLDEFVDPYTYFNKEDNGLSQIDHRLFDIAQLLRYHYMKPIYINNWWWLYDKKKDEWSVDHIIKNIEERNSYYNKPIYKWSGLRTDRCNIGSKLSAHRSGQAIDPKSNEIEFFKITQSNAKIFYNLGVRRLEDISITHGWHHIDTLERNTKPNSIKVIDLTKTVKYIYF